MTDSDKLKPKKSLVNAATAGLMAGSLEILIMQPSDVVKTRYQSVRVASHYQQGILHAFRQVMKEEGFLAFYRGTAPVLCIVGPRISLQYIGLAFYKPIFEKMEGTLIPAHSSAGLAGICTGITQAVTLVTPLEMIKVRQQTDLMNAAHERKYHGLINTATSIIRTEGFLALYSGLAATVVRQSWGLLVKFSGYTEIKSFFEKTSKDPTQPLSPWKHMVSGGLANVLVGVLNSPPDVVKTRMQDDGKLYRNTWHCISSMVKNEGFSSFFRGSWLRILRVSTGGAIQFSAYEAVMNYLETNNTLVK
ncbi:mitochondrial carrier domain-containing protein [Halteromyces radiatus]|uniref:mitochondrial carrier domain-containing protein n=1 Tax=Halteromyces radiatus TaxID=101107 RepID=UPI0022203299|nr:mitochondrial carrier domain-containing protein [Halteromyces radiatus]KAI8082922.1 mitochondrial carrier domain-containing protein [Halteromyces radiatus]